jgi:hypothetical protein
MSLLELLIGSTVFAAAAGSSLQLWALAGAAAVAEERQQERMEQAEAALVRAGASRTKRSRHLTGHAVDVAALVEGQVRWDWPLYPRIAAAFKAAAVRQGTAIVWGGDWIRLRDGPHFELDRKVFP